jgi:glycolate oxidase FAD binding subunit
MDEQIGVWAEQVKAAASQGGKLHLAGGGTKNFYGREMDPGEVLDTRPYAGVVSYEPTELVITARAGTPLTELEATLAESGQMLAFEPPHFGGLLSSPASAPPPRGGIALPFGSSGGAQAPRNPACAPWGEGSGQASAPLLKLATLGGAVAAGLSGPRRAAAGALRDYVLGVKLMDGRGEVLSFGGQVMKNVAGYDVSRLVAGSLGTLGLILEVSLKVLPRPVAEATLSFELDEATALSRLNAWGGQPLPISASAWLGGVLHLRLSGAAAAVEAAHRRLGGEALAPEAAAALWQGLREQRADFFDQAGPLWRLSLPSTATAAGLGPQLLEWGGAQRWLVSERPAAEIRQRAAALGGHATLFRGGDRRGEVFTPLAPALLAIHRRLKRAFDPAGVFNPGRMYPEF